MELEVCNFVDPSPEEWKTSPPIISYHLMGCGWFIFISDEADMTYTKNIIFWCINTVAFCVLSLRHNSMICIIGYVSFLIPYTLVYFYNSSEYIIYLHLKVRRWLIYDCGGLLEVLWMELYWTFYMRLLFTT